MNVQFVGILGVVRSDPEVTAVYPSLSSTVITRAQELKIFRGDDYDIGVQVQTDGDPAEPFQLHELTSIRFAAKQGYGNVPTSLPNNVVLGNDTALIYKRSANPDEIEITSSGQGRCLIHLSRRDTESLPLLPAMWDIEITRPYGDALQTTGTCRVTAGLDVVFAGDGLSWTQLRLRRGDLFVAQGKTAIVREVLNSMQLHVDVLEWTSELLHSTPSGASVDPSFQVYRSRTKTVASGPFVVMGDVTL